MPKTKNNVNPRLGTVGGSALMEGVMMKSRENVAIAVRRMDNNRITVKMKKYVPLKNKSAFFRVPIIRGIVNFIDMMIMSFSTLLEAMNMLGLDLNEGSESKFDKWLNEKFGDNLMKVISAISSVLGIALALLLFTFLPTWAGSGFGFLDIDAGFLRSLIEGVCKIAIFISYIAVVSLIPDIKRVFMYHGAEHKNIFCYEKGLELTVENVRKQSRFHPRCGTSFIFVILAISIITGMFIPTTILWLRTLLKLIILPLIVGIGYEYIMYAGKHENALTRILSAPGLWMQRLTTKEPTDDMIEVGTVSLKSSLSSEFPDFEIPYEEKVIAEMKAESEKNTEAEAVDNDRQ